MQFGETILTSHESGIRDSTSWSCLHCVSYYLRQVNIFALIVLHLFRKKVGKKNDPKSCWFFLTFSESDLTKSASQISLEWIWLHSRLIRSRGNGNNKTNLKALPLNVSDDIWRKKIFLMKQLFKVFNVEPILQFNYYFMTYQPEWGWTARNLNARQSIGRHFWQEINCSTQILPTARIQLILAQPDST